MQSRVAVGGFEFDPCRRRGGIATVADARADFDRARGDGSVVTLGRHPGALDAEHRRDGEAVRFVASACERLLDRVERGANRPDRGGNRRIRRARPGARRFRLIEKGQGQVDARVAEITHPRNQRADRQRQARAWLGGLCRCGAKSVDLVLDVEVERAVILDVGLRLRHQCSRVLWQGLLERVQRGGVAREHPRPNVARIHRMGRGLLGLDHREGQLAWQRLDVPVGRLRDLGHLFEVQMLMDEEHPDNRGGLCHGGDRTDSGTDFEEHAPERERAETISDLVPSPRGAADEIRTVERLVDLVDQERPERDGPLDAVARAVGPVMIR